MLPKNELKGMPTPLYVKRLMGSVIRESITKLIVSNGCVY